MKITIPLRNSHKEWLAHSIKKEGKKQDTFLELVRFLSNFFESYSDIYYDHKQSQSTQYKELVFDILNNGKDRFPLNNDELYSMQIEIEDLTMTFDERSMFRSVSNIIKMLIKPDLINAKDYLKSYLSDDNNILLFNEFGQYTIEALIVHVLCMMFHSGNSNNHFVRVSSLIDQLDSSVRKQALLLRRRRIIRGTKVNKEKFETIVSNLNASSTDQINEKKSKLYSIGSYLVGFMLERQLITLSCSSDWNKKYELRKRNGSYFIPRYLYAFCNFDISLLPIKFNLPMICKPLDWGSVKNNTCNYTPINLSDLAGGYLSSLTGDIYDRFRLLSSGNINNFYMEIGSYEGLCRVLNKLQSQPFQINSILLTQIMDNRDFFVQKGLLMPNILTSINMKDVEILLRKAYLLDNSIQDVCSYTDLVQTLYKLIQRANTEKLMLNLAKAYDGYQFYLPAFLDFRGRIYRSGILHFHDRDLARSLIVFADESHKTISSEMDFSKNANCAIAFHYKSFDTPQEVDHWFNVNVLHKSNKDLIEYSREAKHPFQFLSGVLTSNYGKSSYLNIPITQDASASAYQIMSYFLLDETLAKRTNLIRSSDGKPHDVYSFILDELKEYVKAELKMDENLSNIVCTHFNRDLVKGIFMPKIYGKTLMSVARDLRELLAHYITGSESFTIAKICFQFWKTKYDSLECLMQLIRNIGWIASASDCPVFYGISYFTTVQDYIVMEPINIWIYDQLHKKRSRVTLRVSSDKRDRRKTAISTFVNFIHQRDAYIAMKVVELMLDHGAPIYTVHDNFITTAAYSNLLPQFYSEVIRGMGPPLQIINEFIQKNVGGNLMEYSISNVIPLEILEKCLNEKIPSSVMKSNKMKVIWDGKIQGILTSYENYTRYICGNSNPSWEAHVKQWYNFQRLIQQKSDGSGFNYCVHY